VKERSGQSRRIGDSLPYWEIKVPDALGQTGEVLGGVSGLVQTAEAALGAFRAIFPDFDGVPLEAVRTRFVL